MKTLCPGDDFVRNGSGDDFCSAIGIHSPNDSLNYLVKGSVVKLDTVRCLLDVENESSVPDGIERLQSCRHMIINSCLSMPCKINAGAEPMKTCCGKSAYTIQTIKEALKCNFLQDVYGVELDGQKVTNLNKNDLGTILVFVTNGKHCGAGMVINPYSCLNDGLLDFTWISNEETMGFFGIAGALGKAKDGGLQAYDGTFRFKRGKSMKISYLGQ